MHTQALLGARAVSWWLLVLLLIPLGTALAGEGFPASLSPDAAVSAALPLHPQVRAAEAELQTAQAWSSRLRAPLSNPSLSSTVSVDGRRASLNLNQPLSLSGEGPAARQVAADRVEAAEAALQRARFAVAAEVRLTYVDAAIALGLTEVAQDGVDLAARLRQAVGLQYEEGEASELDLRLARLAEVQAAARLLEAREVEAFALRALSERVGRSVAAADLSAAPLQAAPEPRDEPAWERSDQSAAAARLAQAEAELRRQRAASLAPLSLGAFASLEDEELFIGPTLGVTLPIFERNQGPREQAEAQVSIAAAQRDVLSARVESEQQTARRRVTEAEGLREQLVADPLEEARATLRAVEAGYLAGQLDLPDTVLLQREVLDGEAACLALLRQIAAARLDLMLATEDPALLGGAR
ncbi:MAG: TolC family protein [Alphaproteobacteria bacterium]|nr:TolC family protein [Alphaproteobacteria bacterium]